MSYDDAPVFSGPTGPLQSQRAHPPTGMAYSGIRNGQRSRPIEQEPTYFHGEALARDPWAEHYGSWIVLGFTAVFALFLIGMLLAGQAPGKSFLLKSVSDILQFVGEGIGFIFCLRITLRLRRVSLDLRRELLQKGAGQSPASNELAKARAEAQA